VGDHGHSEDGPAAGGAAAFERVLAGHVDDLLGFLVRRTRDPQAAADLTAETLAAALLAPRRDRPERRPAGAWLQALALDRLAEAQRRGAVEQTARRRLGMERIVLTADDAARIGALAEHRAVALWVPRLPPGPPGERPATEDVPTRLRIQLRDAAQRLDRRGALGGAAARLAPASRRGPAVFGLAAALLLAALATGVWSITDAGTARSAPGPRVVTTVAVADGLGRSAQVAFGSVWLSATNDDAVLRVDPRTRRVLARIAVGTDVNLGAGAGGVWAVPRRPSRATTRLIRIDPRTNRVVARIAIPSPGGRYPLGGAAILAGRRVWVVGAQGLVAVDPATNRLVRQVVLGGDFLVAESHLRGNELWIIRADQSITRLDAFTGHRLGRLGWPAPTVLLVPDRDRVVKVERQSVAAADPVGGRTVWRTRLGSRLNDSDIVAERLLVEGADGTNSRDRLWELDPRTGRVLGTMTVPGFSVTALLRVGGEAWVVTADGHVIVVAP
jgi:DNA-directed RNA polymerase specialized sigma24 family protein